MLSTVMVDDNVEEEKEKIGTKVELSKYRRMASI